MTSSNNEPIVEINELSAIFPDGQHGLQALDRLSFKIWPRQFICILGPSASGKSTLLRIIAGLVRPNEGEILLDGRPIREFGRDRIGFLGHEPFLYSPLSLRENLHFGGRLFRLSRSLVDARIGLLADRLSLVDRLDEPVRVLSQGLRQRGALARALLHEPEVLLLDEPFSALDPEAAGELEGMLRTLAEEGPSGRIILFSTHDPGRVRAAAEEVAVLFGGRVSLRTEAKSLDSHTLARAAQEREGQSFADEERKRESE